MASKCLRGNIQESISRVKKAFMAGVNTVQPQELIKKHLQRSADTLTINKVKYDLKHNVYVVGFGKAVIGMVRPVEEALRNSNGTSHLKEGVVSVPVGIQETFAKIPNLLPDGTSVIHIKEGAKDNIPDEGAFNASKMILTLAQRLQKEDLLLVLISGGGSALLPYPRPPMTLDEKSGLVKALSRRGATITELNTVRKAVSLMKGGKLASATEAQIVSLILSDIIDSPLDMIASGPTVANTDPADAAEEVLHKYGITVSENIRSVLEKNASEDRKDFRNVNNCIIGSSETALDGVLSLIKIVEGDNCQALILSSSLSGEAEVVGKQMANFALTILDILSGKQKLEESDLNLCNLCISADMASPLLNTLSDAKEKQLPIWLIFGGETTVHVKGNGRGGRNQEMALSFSIAFEESQKSKSVAGEVVFLSGGTDGMDGPTDAAGAITYWSSFNSEIKSQFSDAQSQGLHGADYLKDNDSYNYFSKLSSGEYLLKPGHTGTNVMDIQILYINQFY